MHNRIIYSSWIFLIIAIFSWLGVGYFAYVIIEAQDSHVADMGTRANQMAHTAQINRINVLASDTAQNRERLATLVQVNPVSLVNDIQTSGNSIGSTIQINNASSVNVPSTSNTTNLYAFSFTAQSQGTFPSLIRTLELLETLPVPSSIQAINIARVPVTNGTTSVSPWHTEVQVQVLTAANISS